MNAMLLPFPVPAQSTPCCDDRVNDTVKQIVYKIRDYKAKPRTIAAARRERLGVSINRKENDHVAQSFGRTA